MDANKIKKGMKLSKRFEAGHFDELYYLRKSSWGNAVHNDLLRSLLDVDYVRKFTDEDVVQADLIVDELILINNQVEVWKDAL